MFNIIKLFIKLFLYKFLLFNLDVFKRFLFEKHFYLFNKFITLYGPSSVSTEFRKVFFSKENDNHDELYGDSNFLLNSKNLLSYLKSFNRLKFNLLNFNYLIKFRQYNRSIFFLKFRRKLFNLKNLLNFLKGSNFSITFYDIIIEKFKTFYAKKSIFSYLYLFLNFLIILLKVLFNNLKKKKKNLNAFVYEQLINNQNKLNMQYYSDFRLSIFNQYLLIKKDIRKKINFNFLKKIDFFYFIIINRFFEYFFFFKKFVFIYLFIYTHLINFVYLNFLKKKKYLIIEFLFLIFLNFKKIFINFFYFLLKIYYLIFLRIKLFNFSIYNFFLNFKFFFILKIFFIYKHKLFCNFFYRYMQKRNISYLNLISILFTIKKDLKKRYIVLTSQTRTRQKNDLKDLDFYDNINNNLPEEKNKDFFFFAHLSMLFKKKKRYLFFNKHFFFSNKRVKQKFFKKFNLLKLKKNQQDNKIRNNLINLYYLSFFSKYLYNMSGWLILLKNNKNNYLIKFILRKIFFYKYIKFLKFKKTFFFVDLNNFLKIRYYRLSNKVRIFFKELNSILKLNLLKKKKRKKSRIKKYLKFTKVNKKIFLNLSKKKKKIITFQIYNNKFFPKKIFIKNNLKKPFKIKKKKRIKLFFSLNFFSHKKFNFNNISLLKNYLLIKLKQKKKIKKLRKLRKKYLNLYSYKILRKRKKLNFITFFEQNENYLVSQKLFSLYISKYKINSWFNDLHNYTFFHKYFILKRDRFWYSVARRESISKYHDGRNMMTDSWDENFLLQLKSLFFFKEGYQMFFILRNNFNSLSSFKFIEIVETSVLKKHGFLSLIWKIVFFNLLGLKFNYLIFEFFFIFQYNFLITFIFFVSIYPIIVFIFIKKSQYIYKLNRIRLRLFLRKPYIKNYNVYFFFNFINDFIKKIFYKFFFRSLKFNFFINSFLGYWLLHKLNNFEKIKKKSYLLVFKMIFIILLFLFFIFFIFLSQILGILVFYDFFYKIFSYSIFIIFNNIFINFILLCFLYFFFNFIILEFQYINQKILIFVVKYFFNNDFIFFLNFLNNFLYKQNYFNNFYINDLNEQLNILKNIKIQQYINSYNNLKKNAI